MPLSGAVRSSQGLTAVWPQRSFCYVDDAVEGLVRVMQSDYAQPLNVGSDEMVCPHCSRACAP